LKKIFVYLSLKLVAFNITGQEKAALQKIITSSEIGALPVAVLTILPPKRERNLLNMSLSYTVFFL